LVTRKKSKGIAIAIWNQTEKLLEELEEKKADKKRIPTKVKIYLSREVEIVLFLINTTNNSKKRIGQVKGAGREGKIIEIMPQSI
jgi:flavoprotein